MSASSPQTCICAAYKHRAAKKLLSTSVARECFDEAVGRPTETAAVPRGNVIYANDALVKSTCV